MVVDEITILQFEKKNIIIFIKNFIRVLESLISGKNC